MIFLANERHNMCGICGFYNKKNISLDNLKVMNDLMTHRGPDDSGEEIYDRAGVTIGMAQRRLSILDLSKQGHQPMTSDNGRITVVYNGEIYNYNEIKKEIPEYSFHSNTDTEVIIASYLKWGIKKAVKKFNGMFAIALYDRKTNELFLVRDRMGVKPLYYWLDGNSIVFSSELKPIMACPGFRKTIYKEVMARYLYHQYINAPDTIFENVYKVEPGTIITCDNTNSVFVKKDKYWDISTTYNSFPHDITDIAEAKKHLKDLLRKSVNYRMISDVPVGSFLSGGYDSSLISAIAQEQLGTQKLKTFAIGVNDIDYDEAPYAKKIAEYLGTEHTEMYISEKEMLDLVESIPRYFDEPFADSSEIPTMLVSKMARNDVTVVLSGDAGDELFCGYTVYDSVKKAQQINKLAELINEIGKIKFLGKDYKHLYDIYPLKVQMIADNINPNTKTQFSSLHYQRIISELLTDGNQINKSDDFINGFLPVDYQIENRYKVKDWQIRRMLLDMDTYLPGDILTKVDRASMKYSLETRCPFLDKNVIEYSFQINQNLKYHKGSKKYILKELAYDYIPRELLDRSKKGFGVPYEKWLRGPLKEQLLSYTSVENLNKKSHIFDAIKVNNFVNEFIEYGDKGRSGRTWGMGRICWSLYVFLQWQELFYKTIV